MLAQNPSTSFYSNSSGESMVWVEGRTISDKCEICKTRFMHGNMIKKLKCRHEFHANCFERQMSNKCPTC